MVARNVSRTLLMIVAQMFVLAVQAQDGSTRRLTQVEDVLDFPGFGKILLAFVVAASLAVGMAVVLRRVLPKLGGAMPKSSRLQVIDRVHLSSAVRVHLVEVEGARVLVAENRGSISVTVLSPVVSGSPSES